MARIPSADEIGKMSHDELVKAWVEHEKEEQSNEVDKEADYEPVSEAGDLQAVNRISKLSPEELEKEWIKQEEAANKSVKKSTEKVTAEDIAWLRKAQQEHRERQPQRVRIEKVMPFFKIK